MEKQNIVDYINYCANRNLYNRAIVFDNDKLFYLYSDNKSYELFDVASETLETEIHTAEGRSGPAVIKFSKDIPLTKVNETINTYGKYAFVVICGNNDQAQYILEYFPNMHFLVSVGTVYAGTPVMEVK